MGSENSGEGRLPKTQAILDSLNKKQTSGGLELKGRNAHNDKEIVTSEQTFIGDVPAHGSKVDFVNIPAQVKSPRLSQMTSAILNEKNLLHRPQI